MAESVCESSLVEACQMETTGGLGSHDSFLNRYKTNQNKTTHTHTQKKQNKTMRAPKTPFPSHMLIGKK